MAPIDFVRLMPEVAARFRGDPNPHLSNKRELRYGTQARWRSISRRARGTTTKRGGRRRSRSHRPRGAHQRQRRRGRVATAHGFHVEDEPPQAQRFTDHTQPNRKIVATYDYVDEFGADLFQVVRFEPKDFRQRRKALPTDEAGRSRTAGCGRSAACASSPTSCPSSSRRWRAIGRCSSSRARRTSRTLPSSACRRHAIRGARQVARPTSANSSRALMSSSCLTTTRQDAPTPISSPPQSGR